jgi:GNAT superfamily N-acetyltransferase
MEYVSKNIHLSSVPIVAGSICHREAVIDIVTTALRSYGLVPDAYKWDREIFIFGENPPEIREFVVVKSGRVIGVGILEFLESSREINRATIRHLYVADGERRSGYGRQLLSHMTQCARAEGACEIELNTREIFTAAVALYESQGWIRSPSATDTTGPELTYRLTIRPDYFI